MFIYACAHSLAKKKKENYCLSTIGDLHFFKLSKKDYKWNRVNYIMFKIMNKLKRYKFEHLQDNREDYSEKLAKETGDNVWYYGYFQGEKYFYGNEKEVRSRFQLKLEHKNAFEKVRAGSIGDKEYVVVHIRLKDYKTFGPDYLKGPDLTLPLSYYHSLIKQQLSADENKQFVFLSDTIDQVKGEFSYVNNAYFSTNSVIEDLQFIMNAKTCILSSSTFSWWGAWLNENENKIIFVPEYFLGFKVSKEYPVNIIPDAWTKVTVQ